MRKPSWKIRRRYIFASFTLGAGMIASAVVAIWTDKLGAGDLITGGVALVTATLTGYVFGAVWEDRNLYKPTEEEKEYDEV